MLIICSFSSDRLGSDLLEQSSELLRRLKNVHFVIHGVFVEDLLEVLAIFITIVNRDCDSLSAKSACATNPMKIVLRVTHSLVASSANSLCGDIEVDHNLDFWYIDTSRKHVGRDDNTDLSCTELLDHLVTLFVAHLTENNRRLQVLTAHHLMQAVRVGFGIDEDDGLSHLANIEDFFDELGLLTLLAAIFELLDVVEGQLFLL